MQVLGLLLARNEFGLQRVDSVLVYSGRKPCLAGATHVIVDEVHERDLHTDFLLTLLRRVLHHRADLKIILMSATVDPSAFQGYFDGH